MMSPYCDAYGHEWVMLGNVDNDDTDEDDENDDDVDEEDLDDDEVWIMRMKTLVPAPC